MKTNKLYLPVIALFLLNNLLMAQDPRLPPTNLGLSNMLDGSPPGTGWFFQEYVQNYQTLTNRGYSGVDVGGEKINSLLSLSQLIYISKTKVAAGNLGFTILVPVVRLSANGSGPAPTLNPNPLGDIIAGPFIQWFNKKLFDRPFSHRLEIDLVSPVGAYENSYMVNPSAHLFTIVPHYTFTLFVTDKFSVSMRHHLNYFFDEIGTESKPGISYSFNYSLEYTLVSTFRAEIAGYYVRQLAQDSYNGNYNYYQDNFNIGDTRERVFAFGPGLGYITPTGLFLELKGMREISAINRPEGFRTTLVLSYKLDK